VASLLIVDDEPNVLNALRRMCLNRTMLPAIPDPSVTTLASPIEAIDYLRDHPVDLVISDFRMPDMDGATFLTRVKLKAAIVDVLAFRSLQLENRRLANEVRQQRHTISRQQVELERLERESPGITHVRWSEDGGVLLHE